MISKWGWSSLIEKDFHLRGSVVLGLNLREALLGMSEHRCDLFRRHTGKPLQKLINRRAGFKVLEERSHRDTGPAKDPCAAYFVFGALDFWTITPIQHNEHDMLRDQDSASSFG